MEVIKHEDGTFEYLLNSEENRRVLKFIQQRKDNMTEELHTMSNDKEFLKNLGLEKDAKTGELKPVAVEVKKEETPKKEEKKEAVVIQTKEQVTPL